LKNFALLWTLSLAVKFLLAAIIPMTTDETYYWVWSQHLQLSYFDHPPFVAWLFWLGHFLEPWGNAVRWPAVLLGHLTLIVWYMIWKNFISTQLEKFSWWFSLALLTPLIGFGSMIVTPDIPVIFFWSLSLFFFLKILKSSSLLDYCLLGASLGLGFCAKYHIVLFVFIALVYLTAEKRWREINFKGSCLTVLSGLLFCSPVLIWNLQNNFISFQFQLKHGLENSIYEFFWTWSYVVAQVLVLFPALIWCATRIKINQINKTFIYFSVGPLLFFFLTSFKASVEVNWPIVAYPTFFVLAVLGAKRLFPIFITCLFWSSLFITISSLLIYPWTSRPPEKIEEFFQFDSLLAVKDQYQPLYASSYQMASWLWYKTKNPTYKIFQMSRIDFFDHFSQSIPDVFPYFVAVPADFSLPDWMIEKKLKVSEVRKLEKNFIIIKVDKQ
jgi:4-amino-4-deoxy-L-arabinose transferase-like glycosyltransferase